MSAQAGGSARGSFSVSRRLFAHGLGLVFFFAFASLLPQMKGLFGVHGIAPAAELLPMAREQLGPGAYWQLPTVFWFGAGDTALVAVCWTGALVSLFLVAGFYPGACAFLLWLLFLSLNAIGSPFLNFQWDALLLEVALPAAVLLPWRLRPDWSPPTRVSRLGRWLLWWLIFRLMFESGVVKLASGDPTWRGLTALTFHYETQPLPLWTSWYAHHAPLWFHRLEALGTFAVEFLAPLCILAPRRVRHGGAAAMIALQIAIATTGNYAFFNLLTALLCLPLLDDALFPAAWRRRLLGRADDAAPRQGSRGAYWVLAPLAALSVLITGILFLSTLRPARDLPDSLAILPSLVAPLRSFNSYGLFAVMTTQRLEIEVQGSNNGQDWLAYEFPWKPGDPLDRPRLVAPRQPRLDWQMWFAALGTYRENPWFLRFAQRLLEGSPEVLSLLQWNPFPKTPPRYLRAVVYEYHYTDSLSDAAWWKRELKGLYIPPISLESLTRREQAAPSTP